MAQFITIPVKNYEIIEHTADIGIRVYAPDIAGLFKNAGLAISQLSAEKINHQEKQQKKISISLEADNLEELFLDWLNELISLSAAKGLIFEDFAINKISETHIEAAVAAADIKSYKVNTEIKAATYHELKVQQINGSWQAEVIFDV